MSSDVPPLCPAFDPARVELSRPGTQRGLPFYVVEVVDADGGRATMWAGTDRVQAVAAAIDCAEGGLPAVDVTGLAPSLIMSGTVH